MSARPDKQRENVSKLYDSLASTYSSFKVKSQYVVEDLLINLYTNHGIKDGDILDLGCGNGGLSMVLGNNFKYLGVDISHHMVQEAESRGYVCTVESLDTYIRQMPDKSVDHVVALSSLYFIEDIKKLVSECERVARKSVCITVENFDSKIVQMMKQKGIQIYNHNVVEIENPTVVMRNVFLWKSPTLGQKVYGDVVFKIIN